MVSTTRMSFFSISLVKSRCVTILTCVVDIERHKILCSFNFLQNVSGVYESITSKMRILVSTGIIFPIKIFLLKVL